MQHYREEVHLRLREAVVKRGRSLRTISAATELPIDELRAYFTDKRASDTTIGRLHSYFHADRQETLRHHRKVADGEPASHFSKMIVLWRELKDVWHIEMPNPVIYRDKDSNYRKAAVRYYDWLCKRALLGYLGKSAGYLPDRENYWQWKIRLGRKAKPGSTMRHWLTTLPNSG